MHVRKPSVRHSLSVLVAAALVALPLLGGSGAVAAAGGPVAAPVSPVVDLGPIPRGQEIRHEFVIENRGDAPLVITEVEPSCGCTVASYDKRIEPGAKGRVGAVVKTEGFRGPIAKSLSVYTNDPENPRIVLVIKAILREMVEVDPGYVRFRAVVGEPAQPSVQTVWSADRQDLEVLGVESPYPFVEAEVRPAADGERKDGIEGRQWRLTVTLAPDAPPGPLADHLQLRTNHPDQKIVQVPLSGLVRPVLGVTPPVANFGKRELVEPYVASLEVHNFATREVSLGAVESDVAGLSGQVEPIKEGRRFQLRVTLDPSMPKGEFEGKLRIATDNPVQPLLEVEVRGEVI